MTNDMVAESGNYTRNHRDYSRPDDPTENAWRKSTTPETVMRTTAEEDRIITDILREALKYVEEESRHVPTSHTDYVYVCVVQHMKANQKRPDNEDLKRKCPRKLIVASAYHPYDSDEPPTTKEVRDVFDYYYYSRKKQLIIGCDANANHILWGSTGTNPRGESFMEFLMSLNLNVLNQGNEPTLVVCNRKEVTNLTLGTNIGNLVIGMYLTSCLYQTTDTYAFK
jgi:hypothetical protein